MSIENIGFAEVESNLKICFSSQSFSILGSASSKS